MLGYPTIRQVSLPKYESVLSYASIAAPLSMPKIIADIQDWRISGDRGIAPDKIELWEHQLDWLKKMHAKNVDRVATAFQVPTYVVSGKSVTMDTIMGIPLEVLK